MRRDVLIESGYRCAMPHCREAQIEIHHIVPYAQVQEHTFDNLIALCANDHQRVTKGEIDRKAVLQIKANLSVLSHRYGDLEQRILRVFADSPGASTIMLPGGLDILVMYLIQDGYLLPTGRNSGVIMSGVPSGVEYMITPSGREFITHWLTAAPLD
jgi:hypothetical protein